MSELRAVKESQIAVQAQLMAVRFEGQPWVRSFLENTAKLQGILNEYATRIAAAGASPMLSQFGRVQEWDRVRASAVTQIKAWKAGTAGAIRAQVAEMIEGARRRATNGQSDPAAKILAFLEDREILADVLTDNPVELQFRLTHGEDLNDPAFRLLNSDVLARRLGKHIGQEHVETARRRRVELAVPELGDLEELATVYENLAETALREVGALPDPALPDIH